MRLKATWTNSEGTLVFVQPGTTEVLVWHPDRDYPVLRVAHEIGINKWGRWTRVNPPVEYDVPEPEEAAP
jgi:hypothetical protein